MCSKSRLLLSWNLKPSLCSKCFKTMTTRPFHECMVFWGGGRTLISPPCWLKNGTTSSFLSYWDDFLNLFIYFFELRQKFGLVSIQTATRELHKQTPTARFPLHLQQSRQPSVGLYFSCCISVTQPPTPNNAGCSLIFCFQMTEK